ncbi:MAG: hypothetical protein MK215_06025, partial [Candidatus Poseidoniia archaeon]|nr:hypothetical protein [Candidatus Poseidoniia archaeon]
RSLDDLANGEQSETKLVHSCTSTANLGVNMANDKKRSLDDLANGEQSETKLVHSCTSTANIGEKSW